MAGETISLDYQPLRTDNELKSGYHDDPVAALYLPGYQLIHSFERWGADAWQVRRVIQRVTEREAFLGKAEEYHTYPEHYPTVKAAEAAAVQLYAQDGPGDVGDPRTSRVAQHVAARQAQAQAEAEAARQAQAQAGGPQIG